MQQLGHEKFDVVVHKLLSVPREEIQNRDKEWRRKRRKSELRLSPLLRHRSGTSLHPL